MEIQGMQAGRFVLDSSVVMAWCMEGEGSPQAETVLRKLSDGAALVPGVWPLEVANGMLGLQDKEVLSEARATRFLELLHMLPIRVSPESPQRLTGEILHLARRCQLPVYEASYLDLALREGLPLATLDEELIRAAKTCRIPLLLE